jgi:hypothetical protein
MHFDPTFNIGNLVTIFLAMVAIILQVEDMRR